MDDFVEDKEMNVYGDAGRESLEENDEISPEEEAFMKGYDEDDETVEEPDDDDYEAAFDEKK